MSRPDGEGRGAGAAESSLGDGKEGFGDRLALERNGPLPPIGGTSGSLLRLGLFGSPFEAWVVELAGMLSVCSLWLGRRGHQNSCSFAKGLGSIHWILLEFLFAKHSSCIGEGHNGLDCHC